MNRNSPRNKTFSIAVTDEEYELLFQAAAMADEHASAWARDHIISAALRTRRLGMAA